MYDDNIWSNDSEKKSSTLATITASGREEVSGDMSRYTADVGLMNGNYFGSSADNYTDAHAILTAAAFPTQRLSGSLSGGLSRLHEARGSLSGCVILGTACNNQVVPNPNIYNLWALDGTLDYGVEQVGAPKLEVTAGYHDYEYQNNRNVTQYRDHTEGSVGTTLNYMIMPATSLLVGGSFKNFNYNKATSLNSDEYEILGGINWKATAATTGYVKGGWGYKSFSAAYQDSTGEFNWDIGVDWSPKAYTNFGLSTNRSFAESNGTGSFNDQQMIKAYWRNAWYNYLKSEVALGHQWNDYPGNGSSLSDEISTLQLTLDYQYDRDLLWSLYYYYSDRDGGSVNSDPNYTRNQIGVRVKLDL